MHDVKKVVRSDAMCYGINATVYALRRHQPWGTYRTTREVKAGEELLLDYTRVLPSVYAHGVLAHSSSLGVGEPQP